MKTILVLTDFSKKAGYAAETAIQLAPKLKTDVLLFNTYYGYPFQPSAEFEEWPPEYYTAFKDESSLKLQKEKTRLIKLMSANKNPESEINISIINLEGSLAGNMVSIFEKMQVTMVIMGGREKMSGGFFFGSDINEVISKTLCPVLIVNRKINMEIKNIAFATDLDLKDVKAVKYLIQLSKTIHFHLHICHVSQYPTLIPDFNEEDKIIKFKTAISKTGFNNISYTNLEGDNIVLELEKFFKKIHTELIAMVYKNHSFFWRIFHRRPSALMIKHQKNNLLIIPEERD